VHASNINDQWLDNRKTTATDKDGNTVQYTYHIGCKEIQTYTINAYLTKCSLLINGENVEKFIEYKFEFLCSQCGKYTVQYYHLYQLQWFSYYPTIGH
jgi:hypothetical protein